MLRIANKEELDSQSLATFPYSELLIIDQLWSAYSSGKFGFGVQKDIFHKQGKDVKKFGKCVCWGEHRGKGLFKIFFWKDQDKLILRLNAPQGHLPLSWAGLNNQIDGITKGSERRIEKLLSRKDIKF